MIIKKIKTFLKLYTTWVVIDMYMHHSWKLQLWAIAISMALFSQSWYVENRIYLTLTFDLDDLISKFLVNVAQ